MPAAAESQTAIAVLDEDPPESGAPTAEELGGEWPVEPIADDQPAMPVPADEFAKAATAAQLPAQFVGGADCSTIVANFDRQAANVWPTASPFTVNWPWAGEIDPQPGDIVGWNWTRGEIAVVTAVPPVTEPWPYVLTVQIRPMPAAWRRVKVYNLNTGEHLVVEWYTRWNRAASNASGWLAVVQEGA